MNIINFPQDFSVGEVLISKGKNGNWEKAIEAKGRIEIPDNTYVSFWLGKKMSLSDLNFLSLINPYDFDEFLAASRNFDDFKFEKILHLIGIKNLQLKDS